VRTSGVAPGFEPPKTLGGQVVWSAKNIFDFSKEGRAESKKYALGFAPEMMAGVASLPQRALEARSVTAASRVAGEGALLYLTGKSVERVAPVVARGYRRVFPEKVEVVRVGGESVGRTVGRKTVYEGGEFVETEAGRFMARADRGVYYGEVKAEVVGVELQSGEGVFGYVQKVDVLSDAGVKVAEVKGFGSGVLERGSSAGVGRQVVRVGEKAGEIFDVEFFGGVKSGKSAEFRVAGTEAEMLGGSFERYGMSVSKPLKGSSESVRFSRGKIDVTEDILLSDRQITLYRQSMLEYDFVQSKQSMRPSKPFLGGKKGQARAVSFETEIDAGFMSEINVGESGLKAGGEPFGKGLFTEDVFRSAVRGVLREQPLTRMTKLGSRSAGVALSGGVSGELVQSASVGKSAVESMFRAESFVGSSEGVIARADMMIDNGVVGEFDVASDVVSASDVRVQSEYLQAVGGVPGLYPNVGFPERGASKSGFNSGIASFKYTPSFGGIVLGVKAPKKKPRIYSGFEIRGF